jgi:hypothetical protein
VARRALPHNLLAFVDLKAGQFQVLDPPLGELLLAGRVGDMSFGHVVKTLIASRVIRVLQPA